MLRLTTVIFLVWSSVEGALELPSYIKPCYINEPNFDECAVSRGNEAIPTIRHGDRKYRVPVMDPLKIDNIEVKDGGEGSPARLNIDAKDVSITGLGDGKLTGSHYDFEKNTIRWEYISPRITAVGKYNISGQILVVPIRGNGELNLTADNLALFYTIYYDKVQKNDGKTYLAVKNTVLDYNMTKAYIKLENLFNGNAELGRDVNAFLNENWSDAVQAVGPILSEAINAVFKSIVENFVEIVPFENIFPESVG